MIIHSKPTPYDDLWYSRGRLTVGRPSPDKPKEEEKPEFIKEEEFKV